MPDLDKSFLSCVYFSIANIHIIVERRHIINMASVHTENIISRQKEKGNERILSIEELLCLELPTNRLHSNSRILTIHTTNNKLLLEVEEPVELVEVAYNKIHPLPGMLASNIKFPFIRALVEVNNEIGLVIDPLKITVKKFK